MSKRDQGAAVDGYIEGGYVPEAVRNFLCLLGWSPKDDREKMEISEVIERFEALKRDDARGWLQFAEVPLRVDTARAINAASSPRTRLRRRG